MHLNDVSVSRYHCLLKWQSNELYIEDNKSKFGTLVLLRQPQQLSTEKTYSIQCSNTMINLSVTQSWSFFSCFEIAPQASNRYEINEEDKKSNVKAVLPGNGKHSVLVVTKKSYDKLILHEEKKKKVNLNRTSCCSPIGARLQSSGDKDRDHSIQFFRQRTMAQPANKLHPKNFENHLEEFFVVQSHHGDNADDFNFDDCE